MCVCVLITQSCLTLFDPKACRLPGSSVRRIFQAGILEWVAISFSRGSYQPRDGIWVSCIASMYFTIWATREAQLYVYIYPTMKKAEHQRNDALELWCWRRLLRVPWTAGRSNQFILKEINPEYSLEGLRLKLKLQYFGHLMWRLWLIRKDPDVGKAWKQKRRQRLRWWDSIPQWTQWKWVWANSRR